ncbi:MAG TPA: hypothetical protein DEA46_02880 [Candidatus Moranbacteria bacterium]|nr:hypothetical protein [Candidatus Moranbacteria bacterium]
MNTEKIRMGNAGFFVVAVGMSLGTEFFRQAVLESSLEMAQFPTENFSPQYPGYVRIDSSAIRKKGEKFWQKFVTKVREKSLLSKSAYGFSSQTKFEGDFAEQVTLREDGYVFAYHIKQYERDAEHGFEIISPEDLESILEDETLGRVAYLEITQE